MSQPQQPSTQELEKQATASISKLANDWATSPFPAWTFSAALLLSPALRPKIPVKLDSINNSINNSISNSISASNFYKKNLKSAYPSNIQVALFSSFIGLGGFMCYDKDLPNGQITIGVWSLLYL